jgi:hypothetical protein
MTEPPETIVLRHLGGEEREVAVEEATEDGCLHVRWPGGAGVYVVHCFRVVPGRGAGVLLHKQSSRKALPWAAKDLEAARRIWRARTNRTGPREWEAHWENGKRRFVLKVGEIPTANDTKKGRAS